VLEGVGVALGSLGSVPEGVALVAPTATAPEIKLLEARSTGATPVPVNATVSGPVRASPVSVSVAVRIPGAEGAKVTVMLQLCPGPSVVGLRGQFPTATKSAAAVPPLMTMLPMLRDTAWVFLRVALIAALDWFRAWLPKDKVEGVSRVWANADDPRRRRESERTVSPSKRLVP